MFESPNVLFAIFEAFKEPLKCCRVCFPLLYICSNQRAVMFDFESVELALQWVSRHLLQELDFGCCPHRKVRAVEESVVVDTCKLKSERRTGDRAEARLKVTDQRVVLCVYDELA